MKNHFVYLVLVLLSCTQTKKEEDNTSFSTANLTPTIKVDPTTAKATKFSDIFENIRLIPLETSEENLIGEVVKVIFSEEKFFIMSSNSLLIFDKEGKFLSKIASKGLGPEEYRTLWDMQVDVEHNVVEVLDTPGRKILTFDFDGTLLNSWQHDLIVEAFLKMDNNNYLFYCGNNFNTNTSDKLIYTTKGTNTLKAGFFKVDEKEANYLHFKNDGAFFKFDRSHYFIDPFGKTVYRLDKDGPEPKLMIDFGKHELPKEFLRKSYDNAYAFVQEVRKNDYAFLINSFFENDNVVFFAFEYGDEARFVVHYKKTNHTKVISNIEDDINFNSLPVPDIREYAPKAWVEDSFLILIQPSILIERIESIKRDSSSNEWEIYKQQNPEIIDIYTSAKNTDNPIICLAKIKGIWEN